MLLLHCLFPLTLRLEFSGVNSYYIDLSVCRKAGDTSLPNKWSLAYLERGHINDPLMFAAGRRTELWRNYWECGPIVSQLSPLRY
jgi:hypothetical protein